MLTELHNGKGFTLIELLIVVAIIGILAAVAIPQFSSYRMKAFNSASLSDIKNAKVLQESLFTDNLTFGASENASLNTISGAGGAGTLVVGPASAAANTVLGAALAGLRSTSSGATEKVGVGFGVSNGVSFYATNIPGAGSAAYVMCAKHIQGNRVLATESTSTPIMYVQNDVGATSFVGVPLAVGGAPAAGVPAAASTVTIILSSLPGGGLPEAKWVAL